MPAVVALPPPLTQNLRGKTKEITLEISKSTRSTLKRYLVCNYRKANAISMDLIHTVREYTPPVSSRSNSSSSSCCCGARSSSNSSTKHLLAAAIPYLLAIYLSSEGSKDNASGLLAGALPAAAAVLAPGSTTTHTKKVTVAARLGQKMLQVTKFLPAVPSGPLNDGKSVNHCCLGHRRRQRLSSVRPRRHQGLRSVILHQRPRSTQQWELVLARC